MFIPYVLVMSVCIHISPDLRNILPITTAKVPIVKFYHVRTGLEGDISLYNTLALHNTHLLATYAAIDRRVKILCYAMKVFAKIYDGKKPEILVDGWNVYFFDDLKPSHWPHYGKNTETVGELWLNLLRFYTEDFDFREHVVCVRQLARLTTFNKQWTSKYIVIEDPFDLNHNLGAGLSRKMTNFIMKALINGRRVFGTPVRHFPPVYPSQMEYFFDPEVLTEGEVAPNDRCCRICGKIGHFMKDCPMRKKWVQSQVISHSIYLLKYPFAPCTPSFNVSVIVNDCGPRPKHRRDSERRSEQPQDKVNAAEESKDQVRHKSEHWRKRDGVDIRCCYLCGSNAHIKKDCHSFCSLSTGVRCDDSCVSWLS
uniref:CCHC-type domain-containing protein n=1 Tax=Amphilophus citrinellus TaxID=61819 RepID=A0A3Q0SHI7_AMPCI